MVVVVGYHHAVLLPVESVDLPYEHGCKGTTISADGKMVLDTTLRVFLEAGAVLTIFNQKSGKNRIFRQCEAGFETLFNIWQQGLLQCGLISVNSGGGNTLVSNFISTFACQ